MKLILEKIIDRNQFLKAKLVFGILISFFIIILFCKEIKEEVNSQSFSVYHLKDIGTIVRDIGFVAPVVYGVVVYNSVLLFEYSFIALTSCIVAEILKYIIHEQRPDKSNFNSFPSGHTMLAFLVAHFIFLQISKIGGIFFYLVGFFIAWTRIYYKKHFIHDVIAGGLLGIIMVQYLVPFSYRCLKKISHKLK